MLTAEECRKLATSYRNQADKSGIPLKTAAVLRDIADSFSGLASQFELLFAIETERSNHLDCGHSAAKTTRTC